MHLFQVNISSSTWQKIGDDDWRRIKDQLPKSLDLHGSSEANRRNFVDAVLWVLTTGNAWRELPAEFGDQRIIHARYRRWSKEMVWGRLLLAAESDLELERILVRNTVCSPHACWQRHFHSQNRSAATMSNAASCLAPGSIFDISDHAAR